MRAFSTLALPLLALAPLTAQQQFSGASSSSNYVISSVELGSGEEADTLLYKVQPSQGAGVVVEPDCASATYVITAGFPAVLDATVTGSPWMTAVRPFFVPQFGNPTVRLHGTEMFLGSTPTVTIGGQPAAVGGRTVDEILVTLPDQPVPGFQPVVVTNGLGSTILTEGVGVLPLLENREPMNTATPIEIRYQGTQNDLMILALGFGTTPTPLTLPGYGYSLQLEPSGLITSTFYFVSSPDGRLEIHGPAIPFVGLFHVQALVLTDNPGYAPGSWTNATVL
jgi:hypothetical protein